MKEFNYERLEKNLSDRFAKSPESNNAQLLSLITHAMDKVKEDREAVNETLDINKAYGKTLDLYGEIVGQPRGVATDEQYRMMIQAKNMQNLTGGDYKSIVKALCIALNCSPKDIYFSQSPDKPATVILENLPINVVNNAGMTTKQVVALVKQLLPVGISLEQYSFEGTFMFHENDWVETETNGFAWEDENGTVQGGYLGTIGHFDDEEELPI